VSEAVDVVVVGAGVSGLAAARRLLAAGRAVIVLEARDRVGGRLLSVPFGDTGVDLGATWYWANEPRMRAVVAELGLETHEQYLAGDALYQDPRGVQRIAGNPIDGPAGRLTGGMQSLARAMAETLPSGTVRLEQVVSSIRAEEGGLEVETPSGGVRAPHVVLAVPPALALSRIDIDAGLEVAAREVALATPVWMGAMTKVVVRYATPFWREHGLAGAVMSHVGPMREMHDMSGPDGRSAALFGFVPPAGRGAPTVTKDAVLGQLVDLFGPEASEPGDLFIHDWREESHTSPDGVEALQAYETYGHPVYRTPSLNGRLHWVSTETSTEFPGHIEGALAAGARGAEAILGSSAHRLG